MLSLDFIRTNQSLVEEGAKNKGITLNLSRILELDNSRKDIIQNVQHLREKRNNAAKKELNERIKEEGRKLKDKLKILENQLQVIEKELNDLLLLIPNIPAPDVKKGKNDTENDVIRTWGTPKKFDFKVRDHLEIGEYLDIIDVKRASKVSGPRFAYLKKRGVMLEFALLRMAFDMLVKEGFIPIIPPVLIKKDVMKGLGYMEYGGEEDMFSTTKDDLYLVGTAEHSVVPLHKDEVFARKELPKRYVAFSTAFRREAGSYGKDTRGTFRNHQFNKVEMVSFTAPEESDKEHDYLLSLEEKFFQTLEIPYQVVKMCTGDLGFPAARKFDIEAWIPSQNKYREVTSASTITDFQSRRLNIKYQDVSEKKYVHVLNGTACAMSRTPIAIIENFQQSDGSVVIPKALQSYTGFDRIIPT